VDDESHAASVSPARTVGRWALALVLAVAGVGHFTSTDAFTAQVPTWLPLTEVIVYASGVVELVLAAALLLARRHRAAVGWIVAGFFVMVFPGNVSQLITQTDAFGLDTDLARAVRLLFQPLLVVWTLWSTGAWRAWQARRARLAA
jgi:uncharacterized membrane protein